MIAFLSLVFHVVVSPFKTRARLEAEIALLRHQLNMLRRHVLSKPKLAIADKDPRRFPLAGTAQLSAQAVQDNPALLFS